MRTCILVSGAWTNLHLIRVIRYFPLGSSHATKICSGGDGQLEEGGHALCQFRVVASCLLAVE